MQGNKSYDYSVTTDIYACKQFLDYSVTRDVYARTPQIDIISKEANVVLIRLGIYLFVNKARGVGAPNVFSYFVMSQLYETEIP
jgi:hypothetical protein